MSESTQTAPAAPAIDVAANGTPALDNTAEKQPETPAKLYDASADNRLPYKVVQDGFEYEIGHVIGPVEDDRFVQWQKDWNIRGTEGNLEEEAREANCKLWREVAVRLDNVEIADG